MTTRVGIWLLFAGLLGTALPALADVRADFNGDGYDDLAIGSPQYTLRPNNPDDTGLEAGQVTVLYGTADGVAAVGSQHWNLDMIPGHRASRKDHFGSSLAAGDFDGDGWADLAVAAMRRDIDGVEEAGAVFVLHGTASGLAVSAAPERAVTLSRNLDGVPGEAATGGWFGLALVSGDFDGDGLSDLAVSSYRIPSGGGINVLYGSLSGLSGARSQEWHQDSVGIRDTREFTDRFGLALAAGDFDGDGFEDLAVGNPEETLHDGDPREIRRTGIVQILFGSAAGVSHVGNERWHQNVAGVLDRADRHDGFASALAAGDLNGDGLADLAVGVVQENVNDDPPRLSEGAVHLFYGAPSGLTVEGNRLWDQNSLGSAERSEAGDFMGGALTCGDFDGDGYDDVAIGVEYEDLYDETPDRLGAAGLVHVLFGSAEGVTADGVETWTADSPRLPGRARGQVMLGETLTSGDFDGDGFSDLAIGIPEDFVGQVRHAGAVLVIPGDPNGLRGDRSSRWTQGSEGVEGGVREYQRFGDALR